MISCVAFGFFNIALSQGTFSCKHHFAPRASFSYSRYPSGQRRGKLCRPNRWAPHQPVAGLAALTGLSQPSPTPIMTVSRPLLMRRAPAAAGRVLRSAHTRLNLHLRPLRYHVLRQLIRLPRCEARCMLILPCLMCLPMVMAGAYLLSQGHWLAGLAGAGLAGAACMRATRWLQRILRLPLRLARPTL